MEENLHFIYQLSLFCLIGSEEMSSEYSYCSENGFDEMSSSSDSGFDVSFESPKHEINSVVDSLFPPIKEEKKKKTRNTRCKSPTQVKYNFEFFFI